MRALSNGRTYFVQDLEPYPGHTLATWTKDDVYLAQQDTKGKQLLGEQRLTADTRFDWPSSWIPDGKAMLLVSNRDGADAIFRRAILADTDVPIIRGTENVRAPRMTPDGQWLLYQVWPEAVVGTGKSVDLMRAPVAGGPGTVVLQGRGSSRSACLQSPAA